MARTFGFGIIGTGAVAKIHAEAIRRLDGGRLLACYSTNEEKGAQFAEQFDIRRYRELEELLDDDAIDVVSICSPSGAHLEPAIAASKKGKHLVIEKPLEITEERCDRIIDTAKQHGVSVATVFQNRYHPAARRIKEAIEAGRFGALTMAIGRVLWYRDQDYYSSSTWKGTWRLDGGGALMNQSIHVVDLMQWYMGAVRELQALAACRGHEGIEVEDTAAVLIRFESGAYGLLAGTTAAYPGSLKSVEITGSGGTVALEEHRLAKWEFLRPSDEDLRIRERYGTGGAEEGGGTHDPMDIGYTAHLRQYEEICSALEEGRSPEVDGEEGKKSVSLIRRIYRSAGLVS